MHLNECLALAASSLLTTIGSTNDRYDEHDERDNYDDNYCYYGDDRATCTAAESSIVFPSPGNSNDSDNYYYSVSISNNSSNNNNNNNVTVMELQECLSGWFFKSTTTFHNYHALNLPWYFGLLCFSFTLGGIVLLYTTPKWINTEKKNVCCYFPYKTFAWILILVQGPLSFLADYINMTNDSVFHTIDRFLACPLMTLEMMKLVLTILYHYTTNNNNNNIKLYKLGVCMTNIIACIFALSCFLKSNEAQANYDRDGFVFWHNLWHTYPLVCSVIALYDKYILGDYDGSDENVNQNSEKKVLVSQTHQTFTLNKDRNNKKDKKPRLLSTIVMEEEEVKHPIPSSFSPSKRKVVFPVLGENAATAGATSVVRSRIIANVVQ